MHREKTVLVAFLVILASCFSGSVHARGGGGRPAGKAPGMQGTMMPGGVSSVTMDYGIELLPGQAFDGWYYYWTYGNPLSADFKIDPPVSWLSISPSAFVSNSCSDVIPIRFSFTAPSTPGFYETIVVDLNSNWDSTFVYLSVADVPSYFFDKEAHISPGGSAAFNDTVYWNGFDVSHWYGYCGENPFVPDSLCAISYSVYPQASWLSIQPSNFTVSRNDSVVVLKTVSSDASGSFWTFEIESRQWWSNPTFIRWTLNVDVGVENEASATDVFQLGRNFPNPFNPVTTIDYSMPRRGRAILTIHDALGRRVATLADRFESAGRHSVTWNSAGFASGLYFYRLQAGEYTATKKLVLMR